MQKLLFIFVLTGISIFADAQESVARQWNEELLEAIRNDFARPTVHARNLFHSSVVMYDIWSTVIGEGDPYLLGDTVGTYISTFPGFDISLTAEEQKSYIEEAISYAMYDLLLYRFRNAPQIEDIRIDLDNRMAALGYSPQASSGSYPGDQSARAFGRFVTSEIIVYGRQDGANERNDYDNTFYRTVNQALLVSSSGNEEISDPNRWQPLAFDVFIDQSGNEILSNIPDFLGPEWGLVTPFSLKESDLTIFNDDGDEYWVYKDPGPPPYLSEDGTGVDAEDYKWGFSLVAIWSSMLDPDDGVMWEISPVGIGNIDASVFPEAYADYGQFYNLFDGGDPSIGRSINPVTGEPYESQVVPRADYARVLAEFWADGPDSETPPGHWFTILHEVMDHPDFVRKWQGSGSEVDELEYDVKAFFTLGGAMHDAAVTTWGIKGWYDYVRPVSVIRYMASKGQSTDDQAENYDPHGLPLIQNYIEVINEGDELAQADSTNVGKIKMWAWKGPDAIADPENDVAGVGWILADSWWPYQRPTFVSPPFAGYTSGHSCFSRAAAEVMTMMTGDEYFPGGMGVFKTPMNEFLVFEDGPSVEMELQWATYRDASDQTSLSRIWGGIHPPQDDIPGRRIGIEIGIEAFNYANKYFENESTSTFDQVLIADQFEVYPNLLSSHDRLQIRALNSNYKEVKIELYSPLAERFRSEKIRPSVTSLDMSGLRPGKYFLHLIFDSKRQIEEIVIIE